MKLINLHKQWMETGRLPEDGLCNSLPGKYQKYINGNRNDKTIEVFKPTKSDIDELYEKRMAALYWGSGLYQMNCNRYYSYTPLRQTIVLLICCMEGEY